MKKASIAAKGAASDMSLLCQLNRHAAHNDVIENEGRRFSRCRRCSIDLVERGKSWGAAPKGYRIVWRSKTTTDLPTSLRAEKKQMPMVVEVDRQIDRRQPGTKAFAGLDRRQRQDRRARF